MCCVLVRPLTQSPVINKSEEQITHKPEFTPPALFTWSRCTQYNRLWKWTGTFLDPKQTDYVFGFYSAECSVLYWVQSVSGEVSAFTFFYLSSSVEKERSSSSLATQAESVRALHNDKSLSAKQNPNNKTNIWMKFE